MTSPYGSEEDRRQFNETLFEIKTKNSALKVAGVLDRQPLRALSSTPEVHPSRLFSTLGSATLDGADPIPPWFALLTKSAYSDDWGREARGKNKVSGESGKAINPWCR
jgi:hypothetical protein